MSFCIKSTQVWVFPERRDTEKLFPLTCGGGGRKRSERGAVRGHENVMLLCVSFEAQFKNLHHKSIFLIDSIIELYVKWSSGAMSR